MTNASKKNLSWHTAPRQGIALVLTLVIVAVSLAAALLIASIFLGQFHITSDVAQSARAVAAADAGAEQALFAQRRGPAPPTLTYAPPSACNSSTYTGTFPGGLAASYCVYYDFDSASDPFATGNPANFVIRSIGTVQDVSRAFEILLTP